MYLSQSRKHTRLERPKMYEQFSERLNETEHNIIQKIGCTHPSTQFRKTSRIYLCIVDSFELNTPVLSQSPRCLSELQEGLTNLETQQKPNLSTPPRKMEKDGESKTETHIL